MARPVKWRRILAELAAGRKLTRFDAEHLGDHTLPQTIHRIEAAVGIKIEREFVTVPGWAGCPAHVARYSLSPVNREKALAFLGGGA